MFSDILLTVDFDRTLTGPDGTVPERNLEAIRYFMDNGGKFTVNTGRSTGTFWPYLHSIPHNAPFLLYNGSATWDNGELTHCITIDMDIWETMETVHKLFPDLNLEIQGADKHYHIDPDPRLEALYAHQGWRFTRAAWGQEVGPFLKFSFFGSPDKPLVSELYLEDAGDAHLFDHAEKTLRELYGDKVDVYRAAPRIVDVHAKGVSKIAAARRLQRELGRKLLVCVGDGENDIPMLDGADYAFCPGDAIIKNRYENVCNCGEGAVADVIYKKIPEILKNGLDTQL